MAIKVIGVGFGRTGTMSLKVALEELGFDKCYHMKDVFENPKQAKFWYEASQGKPANWDEIFKGYQATVDWPGLSFYEELMEKYPNAKVLLTVRDPDRWYDSALNTVYRGRKGLPRWVGWFIPPMKYVPLMINNLIWDGAFEGKFEDKQYAIDVFEQHIEQIKSSVPPDKLLVYEVKQGWEPLCRFLNVPIPEGKPFPHVNDRAEFNKMVDRRARLIQLVPIALLLFLLFIARLLMNRE